MSWTWRAPSPFQSEWRGEARRCRIAAASGGRAVECSTLERAVGAALERLRPGDALLLSPGGASWDQYVSFEQRGDEFVLVPRRAPRRQQERISRAQEMRSCCRRGARRGTST